jgi:hypothetical protein
MFFDSNGNLIKSKCGSDEMTDASYSNGIFAFTNYDDYVYLYDASRRTWTYVYVGDEYDDAITILPNGDFIACQTRCAYFRKLWWSRWGSEWSKKWDVDVGKVVNGPAVYNNSYAYIPDTYGKVLIVNIGSGRKEAEMSFAGKVYDVAICKNYLAVSTENSLYLYKISNPTDPTSLWRVEGFNDAVSVTFSPDCKYIAVADSKNAKVKVYDINGNMILEKEIGTFRHPKPLSVAWWFNRLAVGYDGYKESFAIGQDNKVRVFEVNGYVPPLSVVATTTTTITTTYLTTTTHTTYTTTTLTRTTTTTYLTTTTYTSTAGTITTTLTSTFWTTVTSTFTTVTSYLTTITETIPTTITTTITHFLNLTKILTTTLTTYTTVTLTDTTTTTTTYSTYTTTTLTSTYTTTYLTTVVSTVTSGTTTYLTTTTSTVTETSTTTTITSYLTTVTETLTSTFTSVTSYLTTLTKTLLTTVTNTTTTEITQTHIVNVTKIPAPAMLAFLAPIARRIRRKLS